MEDSRPLASTSFDKTTHSQMLERYLRELADIDAEHLGLEPIDQPAIAHPVALKEAAEIKSRRDAEVSVAGEVAIQVQAEEPQAKRARVATSARTQSQVSHPDKSKARPLAAAQNGRAPLRAIAPERVNRVREPLYPTQAPVAKAVPPKPKPVPVARPQTQAHQVGPPKVTDFTFQVVGQHQATFQERLAAWQAREAEAARAGRPALQPLALPPKDPAKQARKAERLTLNKRKSPAKAREFNWHSDKRAKERKDFEERLREKEQILAELAEIKRLEAEAAELEAIRKMRAAQVPRAHPVPAFVRSRKRA